MFTRSSTMMAQQALLDAGIAHVRDAVLPAMSHIDGCLGVSLMVDRESGRCIATSSWLTEEAMRASSTAVNPIRDEAARAFGSTTATVDQWEVTLMHRLHHARPGTCMRATWSEADPGRSDELAEQFRLTFLPKIEDLPGFCSASLMVDRGRGRAVTTIGYDDAAALAATRTSGEAIREQASRDLSLIVTEVGEFDLAVAHLRVPELV